MYYSREGFQSGYFLSTIDHDIMTIEGKIVWPVGFHASTDARTPG
jgi:hypothetical protein